MLATPASAIHNPDQLSPTKQRRRTSPKGNLSPKDSRTELLEENRNLRIRLEASKDRLRRFEALSKRQKKAMIEKDALLNKYRAQFVGLFEDGDEHVVKIDLSKAKGASPTRDTNNAQGRRPERESKVEEETMSHSQEEDWSYYSGGSGGSHMYDGERSEDRARNSERDAACQSEMTNRKHRRTRAPAWTQEEEQVFMEAYRKFGCQWKMFQDSLPGRSRRQIQSHGSYLIRQGKLLKKNSRPWQRRKPRNGVASSLAKDVDIDVDVAVDSEND